MTVFNDEALLSDLTDKSDLKQLITDYLNLADSRRWEEWVLCFTEDAVFDLPNSFGRMEGRKNIFDVCVGAMEGTWSNTQHMIVNMDFDVDGDCAKGTANIIFVGVPADGAPTQSYMMGGKYRWQFVRTDEGWKIADAWEEFLWNNGGGMEAVFDSE